MPLAISGLLAPALMYVGFNKHTRSMPAVAILISLILSAALVSLEWRIDVFRSWIASRIPAAWVPPSRVIMVSVILVLMAKRLERTWPEELVT